MCICVGEGGRRRGWKKRCVHGRGKMHCEMLSSATKCPTTWVSEARNTGSTDKGTDRL